jgi:hypothetical protein
LLVDPVINAVLFRSRSLMTRSPLSRGVRQPGQLCAAENGPAIPEWG